MSERETRSASRNKSSKALSVSSGTKRNKSIDYEHDQTNLESEKSIIQDTYGMNNNSESDKTDDTITNIKKRTKTHNERDEDTNIMEKDNNTHYPNQQLQNSHNNEGLDKSLHSPTNRKDKSRDQNSDNNPQNSNSNLEGISNTASFTHVKHKHTPESNTKENTIMTIENNEFFSHKGQPYFYSFALLNTFHNYHDEEYVKYQIRTSFSSYESFAGILNITAIGNIPIVIIKFSNEVDRNALNRVTNNELKVTFYNYDQELIDKIIAQELLKLESKSIKLIDVPLSLETQYVIEIVNKKLGQVHSYRETIKNKRPLNGPNNSQRSRNQNRYQQPVFKQLTIIFKNETISNNIYKENIWALQVENFFLRIIPTTTSSDNYTKRTSFGYKITGLPVNATTQDLKPILKSIKAKTCTIQPKHPRATFKCAYVYVEEQDFQEKIVKISTLNTTIFVFPQILNKHCSICGNPSHEFTNCNTISPSSNQEKQPIYRKPEHNKINRTNINSIRLNNDIQKKFKHLISNDNSSKIVNLEREKFFQRTMNSNKKDNTITPNLNDDSNPYEYELLAKEIEELKKTVKSQSQQIKEIKEENSQLKRQIHEINSNLSNVNKEIISLKETNKSIDKKTDIIINKLNEQQEISQYQYRTQQLGSLQTNTQSQEFPQSFTPTRNNHQQKRPLKTSASQYECESISLEKAAEIEEFDEQMNTELNAQHHAYRNPLYDEDTESLPSNTNNYIIAESSYKSYNPAKYLPGFFKNN
jgi:hypothetical protein